MSEEDLISRTLGKREQWIPFVGAGVSVESGIPLAATIVEKILRKLGERFKKRHGSSDSFLKKFESLPLRMEAVLDQCHQKSKSKKSLLASDQEGKYYLFKDWYRRPPNELHGYLARRLAGGSAPPVVFTTNVDILIEKAFEELTNQTLRVVEDPREFEEIDLDAWKANPFPILFKLHGTAYRRSKEDGETIQMSLASLANYSVLEHKEKILQYFAGKYSFSFLGYSGHDEFDLLPLLVKIKEKDSAKPWVWVDHVDPSAGVKKVYSQTAQNDPIEKILGRRRSERKAVEDYRLYVPTKSALGLSPKAEPSQLVKIDTQIDAWCRALSHESCDQLVVSLFEIGEGKSAVTQLFENGDPLHTLKNKPHLFVQHVGSLLESRPTTDQNSNERAGQIETIEGWLDAEQVADPDTRAQAWGRVGLAWRELGRPFRSYRAFSRAVQTAPVRFEHKRQMLVGYQQLARLTIPVERVLAAEKEGFSEVSEALRKTLAVEPGDTIKFDDLRDCLIHLSDEVVEEAKSNDHEAREAKEKIDGARRDLVWALLDFALVLKDLERPEEGLAQLEVAITELHPLGDVLLHTTLLRQRAWLLWDAGETERALEDVETAANLNDGLGDEFDGASIRRDRGFFLCFRGRIEEGLAEMGNALEAFEDYQQIGKRYSQTPWEIVQVHRVKGQALIYAAARYDEGVEEMLRGLKNAIELGETILSDELRGWLVEVRKSFGHRMLGETLRKLNSQLGSRARTRR